MNFNTIRSVIQRAIDKQVFSSEDSETNSVNKIICGVLLYENLMTLVSHDNRYNTDISSAAESYASTIKNTTESLEKQYLSYKTMKKKIKDYNIVTFLQINKKQIDELIDLYHDKRVLERFSTIKYSASMYAVHRLNQVQDIYLEKVHLKVIIPIVKYYISTKNITENDVTTENVLDNNPGKIINLAISKVSPSQILTDIETGRININNYVYNTELTSDGYVQITMY